MLKLVAALLLVAVACHGFSTGLFGDFQDRPDLLQDPAVQEIANYAVGNMFGGQNPALKNVRITSIQTRVIRGVQYKIGFIGENGNGGQTTCEVVVFLGINGEKLIQQSQCQQ